MHIADEDDFHQAFSDARRRQRRPRVAKPIGDVVNHLLARRGYGQIQQGLEWDAAWRETAGELLARNSRPGRLNRGVLEIIVRNSSALQELTFRKSQLLKKLKAVTASDEVRDLRFRVGQLD